MDRSICNTVGYVIKEEQAIRQPVGEGKCKLNCYMYVNV